MTPSPSKKSAPFVTSSSLTFWMPRRAPIRTASWRQSSRIEHSLRRSGVLGAEPMFCAGPKAQDVPPVLVDDHPSDQHGENQQGKLLFEQRPMPYQRDADVRERK